jgi:hypothetical protein
VNVLCPYGKGDSVFQKLEEGAPQRWNRTFSYERQ